MGRVVCSLVALAALGAQPLAARGADLGERKVAVDALSVQVERFRLANGLVVLLAPDPSASSAAVWMSFGAGALYAPPGRSGMPHLVEHLLASGPTPETDYAGILERRGARHFNARTGFDRMTFEVVVPAEELPAALWVRADRLVTVPPLLDDATVERNRRVVLEERALTDVDVPYGLFHEHVLHQVFAAPHPLHAGVIGTPEELSRVTADEVRRFVADRLVASGAILTVVGRFEPGATRARVEELFGGLPARQVARAPRLPPLELGLIDKRQEPLGRCPRVTMAWRFPTVAPEDEAALALGAKLLMLLTDGAWDMRVSSQVEHYEGEELFVFELSVPYDEPMNIVHGDADGLLRQLTRKEMPLELVWSANLALDRIALQQLDSVAGRARLLTELEEQYGGRHRVADLLGWHWLLEPGAIRDTSRTLLSGPSVVVHARPTRPRPARVERQ